MNNIYATIITVLLFIIAVCSINIEGDVMSLRELSSIIILIVVVVACIILLGEGTLPNGLAP